MMDILDVMQALSFPVKAGWSLWLVCGAGLLFWRMRRVRVTAVGATDVDADTAIGAFDQPSASEAEDAYAAAAQPAALVERPASLDARPEPALLLNEGAQPQVANVPPIAEAGDVAQPPIAVSQFQVRLFESYGTEDTTSKRAEKRRRRTRRADSRDVSVA
jgi:hypothetical protein